MTSSEGAGGTAVRLVVTLMFVVTMGMLLYLFHGERPPEFYERGGTRREQATPADIQRQSPGGRSQR
jgi:hypothetical protein